MEDAENINQTDTDSQGRPKTSKMALASAVFGILGPLSAGAMWVVSFNKFLNLGNPLIIGLFSCGLAWILGLVFGIKSLEQINNSEGQLFGKEYAMAGIVVSAVWMVLILAGLLLPALFYVNS